ncbi:MAG: hypothetical protein KBA61_14545 [Spirochaetes bacterium]|nr:hypothetical protein [Spirochaetota bacterium]
MRFLLTIACVAALVIGGMAPAGAQEVAGDGYSINLQMGFGWAHNIMLADWMNDVRDLNQFKAGTNQNEENEENSVLYSGFDIEPRIFSGKLVYALSFGYHNALNGKRKVTGDSGTLKIESDITYISLKGTVFYKIDFSSGNYLLLGGGLGYYRPTLSITYSEPSGYTLDGEGTGWTIGWHTQLEYNITLGKVVMSLGVLSRFVEGWNIEVEDSNGNEFYDQGVSLTGIYFYVGAGYMI